MHANYLVMIRLYDRFLQPCNTSCSFKLLQASYTNSATRLCYISENKSFEIQYAGIYCGKYISCSVNIFIFIFVNDSLTCLSANDHFHG